MSPSERREMIFKENTKLSLRRQCKLLKISRPSIYYTPVGFSQTTINLMQEFDQIFTKSLFLGASRSRHTCLSLGSLLGGTVCAVR